MDIEPEQVERERGATALAAIGVSCFNMISTFRSGAFRFNGS